MRKRKAIIKYSYFLSPKVHNHQKIWLINAFALKLTTVNIFHCFARTWSQLLAERVFLSLEQYLSIYWRKWNWSLSQAEFWIFTRLSESELIHSINHLGKKFEEKQDFDTLTNVKQNHTESWLASVLERTNKQTEPCSYVPIKIQYIYIYRNNNLVFATS